MSTYPTNIVPSRLVHLYWEGVAGPAPVFRALLRRFLSINTSMVAVVWHDGILPPLINERYRAQLQRVAFRSDLVRYEIIAAFGGLWRDWDIIAHRPVEGLFGDYPVTAEEGDSGHGSVLNNGWFYAPRGHPFAWSLVTEIARSFPRNSHMGPRHQVGIPYFTDRANAFWSSVIRLPSVCIHPMFYANTQTVCRTTVGKATFEDHFFNSSGILPSVEALVRSGQIECPPENDQDCASRTFGMTPLGRMTGIDPSVMRSLGVWMK